MPIDSRIALGVQPLQIPQQDPNQGLNALARVMQIQGAQSQNALAQYSLGKAQREDEDQNFLRQALSQPDADPYKVLLGRGMVKQAGDFQKSQAETASAKATEQAKLVEAAQKRVESWGQAMGYVRQNPTPENAIAATRHLVALGIIPQEQAQSVLSGVTNDPQSITRWATMGFQAALGAKDQLPKYDTRNLGGSTQMTATDPVTGQVKVVNSAANTQSPDNAATNARIAEDARLSRKQAQEHFDAGQNTPQYMMTDAGLVALPKRPGAGQAPAGTIVTGQDGQPLGKPLKDIPPAQNAAIIENQKALQNIDAAIAEIAKATGIGVDANGNPTRIEGASPTAPNAFGARNLIGEGIRQRTDPEGVGARARVAMIGSQKYHDLSGANVTASESPRLSPFIPSATDTPEVALKKLLNLRREYSSVNDMLGSTYSKAQGYRPSPVQPGGGGVVDLNSLPGGGGDRPRELQWK